MRAAHLFGRAVRLYIKCGVEFNDPACKIGFIHFCAKRAQFVHFEQFSMCADGDIEQRDIGHDIEHAAAIVAHEAEPRRRKCCTHACCGDPLLNLSPRSYVVQNACDLVEGNASAGKQVGNFGHRTRGAKREPLAGHRRAVLESITEFVVEGSFRLKIQHYRQHAGALNQR